MLSLPLSAGAPQRRIHLGHRRLLVSGIMLGVRHPHHRDGVMNGFRKELLDKILGLNGHLLVQPLESPLTDWKWSPTASPRNPGVRLAALRSSKVSARLLAVQLGRRAGCAACAAPISRVAVDRQQDSTGSLDGFDDGQGVTIGRRLADQLSLRTTERHARCPARAVTPMGTTRG